MPLLPGSFVQARIDGPILRDEVVIPRSAVVGSEPGSTRVFVERNGLVVETPITVVRRLEGQAFVSAGLEPGDRVVLTNLDALSDKARVEVQATVTIADTQTNGQTLIVLE